MRCVDNGLMGGLNLGSYLNPSITKQDTLLDIMNKEAAKKQKNGFTPMINPQVNEIINDKGVYDPKTGGWASSGNQSVALNNLKDREAFNQIINDALAKQGIKLGPKEKMTLTIDQDGVITVSGITDPQKKAKIEETLNTAMKNKSRELLLHIESVKTMNGQETPGVLDKWMVYDFLKNEAGQELDQLKLVNGHIVGANEKFQQIIDGKQDFGEDTDYVREVIAKLKSVLAIGADKIPDLKQIIDFQNGSLIDKDVKIGFGPDQLKTWFRDFVSAQGQWDITA